MNPPGCPMRTVVAIIEPTAPRARGYGYHLKLECGHVQWEAGFEKPHAFLSPVIRRPCLQAPCYKTGKLMGNDCRVLG